MPRTGSLTRAVKIGDYTWYAEGNNEAELDEDEAALRAFAEKYHNNWTEMYKHAETFNAQLRLKKSIEKILKKTEGDK